ncbi:MAG: hypothetical protein ACE3L7_32735 [Candidatus Pristimantibacillus sp.]
MASELAILRYTDDLGRTLTIPLNATQMREWFECFRNEEPFIVYVDHQFRGVNPTKLIDWTIDGVSSDLKSLGNSSVEDLTWESLRPRLKPTKALPETTVPSTTVDSKVIVSSVPDETPSTDKTTTLNVPEKESESSNEKPTIKKNTLFKIECKCGKTYTIYYHSRSTKYFCKHCNEIVFVDYSAGKIQTEEGEAWLMTNTRYVVRQPHPDDVTIPYPQNTQLTNGISDALDKWREKNGFKDNS